MNSKQIGRNAILNWLALGSSLCVAFFLSPFVVHRLGNVGYGVWTVVNSLIAYMGILDLGLRGAVTRFVSGYHASGKHDEASQTVSAAFWLRCWIGLVIVAASLATGALTNSLLRIPADVQSDARWAMAIVGTSFAITITFGIFGAVLAALNRFDLLSIVAVSQTILRAFGIVWVLKSGYGIVALALCELFVVIVANAVIMVLALKVYREVRLCFRRPDSRKLAQLWQFSLYVLLINAGAQIIYYTDNIVVGSFISISAVTFYTIAGSLFEYTRQIVSGLGLTFLPLASSLDARGETSQIRRLLVQGTRATLLIALPMQIALFFRGPTFIGLWVGQEYAHASGTVLQILLIAQVFTIADYTNYNVCCAMGRHKKIALRVLAEGVANLAISIVLARKIGLIGVAWGTVIPSLANHILLGPRYICTELGIPVRQFIWKAWIQTGIAAVPFAVACYLTERFWIATSLFQFFIQIAVILPVFLLGIGITFWKEIYQQLQFRFQGIDRYRTAALSLFR